MKWIGITGSWRISSPELQKDVRTSIAEIMQNGDGIVSGGALGVDQIATEVALKHNSEADRIKIIIPSTLEIFAAHYRNRANEEVITMEQAESLIGLLVVIKSKGSLTEDELLAFQVNNSAGTQDMIDKAKELGMPVTLKQYQL